MASKDVYEVLLDCYSNPTKIGVIFLLSEHEKLTVTEMSKYLDVSRSNLYHFVGQMVSGGVLNEPEVVANKNYVEKYYTLNEELFRLAEVGNWTEYFDELTLKELRTMLASSLLGMSGYLRMSAERMAIADDEEMNRMKEWVRESPYFITYSTMSAKTAALARKHIQSLMNTLTELSGDPEIAQEKEVARLMMVFLPMMPSLPKLE